MSPDHPRLNRLLTRLGVLPMLKRLEDRLFGAISDVTRVTNDGAWRSQSEAGEASREAPPQGDRRRGLPGG